MVDLKKIISEGPCSFNNFTPLIHQLAKGENQNEIDYNYVDFDSSKRSFTRFCFRISFKESRESYGFFLYYDTIMNRNRWNNYMCVSRFIWTSDNH